MRSTLATIVFVDEKDLLFSYNRRLVSYSELSLNEITISMFRREVRDKIKAMDVAIFKFNGKSTIIKNRF